MKLTIKKPSILLEALQELFPDSSKSSLRTWIKQGRVFIDGETASRADQCLKVGNTISLGRHRKVLDGGITILYEDECLVAIEKPLGLLSVATAFEKELTAHAILKNHYRPRKVEVVHRLDQDTSGVMLFALTTEARDRLKEVFVVHALERTYVAVVEGKMLNLTGTWQSHLIEDANYRVHSSRDELIGKPAITHYRCLASNAHYSWLMLTLETGRKNQIRVHCQDAGHPVVGDKKYGAKSHALKRLCLHSYRISLLHPITQRPLTILSPPPKSFCTLIDPGVF
jgi:23S rRNA pseudouridine1911/1915/1917 synthase